jgi:hypothetical protein
MNDQKDQETMQKLLPTWRKALLSVHETGRKVVEFVTIPFTWLSDQINGTADWKATEARLDRAEARKQSDVSQQA